ncbi:MAG: hypothetical protein ABSB67_20260 [Bryobacteraceae bacterium]
MATDRASIQALKNLIAETDLILSTTVPLPENRTPRCRELLRAALALTDDILKQQRMTPSELLGHKGGSATAAKFGPEHFREIAAMRQKHAGGRPRKQAD